MSVKIHWISALSQISPTTNKPIKINLEKKTRKLFFFAFIRPSTLQWQENMNNENLKIHSKNALLPCPMAKQKNSQIIKAVQSIPFEKPQFFCPSTPKAQLTTTKKTNKFRTTQIQIPESKICDKVKKEQKRGHETPDKNQRPKHNQGRSSASRPRGLVVNRGENRQGQYFSFSWGQVMGGGGPVSTTTTCSWLLQFALLQPRGLKREEDGGSADLMWS